MSKGPTQVSLPRLPKRLLTATIPHSALFTRYGLAVLMVGLAVLVKFGLDQLVEPGVNNLGPYLTLFPAVLITAWYGGLGPGLLAIFLGASMVKFLFLAPSFQLSINLSRDGLGLSIFIVENLLLCLLANTLRILLTRARNEVAERRRTEEALRKSEERFRLIQETTPDAFSILKSVRDENGQIIDFIWDYLNPVSGKLAGYPAEILKGKKLLEILPIYKTNGLFNAYVSVMETGQPQQLEVTKSGENGDNWYRNLLIKSGDAISVTSVDISEIKRADRERIILLEREQAARLKVEESRNQISFLLEATNIVSESMDYKSTLQKLAELIVPEMADWCRIHLIDERGVPQQLANSYADPAKHALAVELQNKIAANIKFNPEAQYGLARVLRTGEGELYPELTDEFMVKTAQDDEVIHLIRQLEYRSALIVALEARGRVIGALQLVTTSTSNRHFNQDDLKLARALAQRAAIAVDNARLYEEAQKAIEARSEFLSVAAHELKTPVTSMRGYAQLLLRQIDRQKQLDPARVRTTIVTIEQQTSKLIRLISRLLDLSKLEAGKLSLEYELTDMVGLVERLCNTIQSTTEKHQLIISKPDNLEAMVDPLRFEQVVTNLLDNAIKYSPEGGIIEINLTAPEEQKITLNVRDHGLGIDPKHRTQIFQPFYQAHERGYAGVGMGLYISRQIIELHGGQIEMEFPDEGGSCFKISIPRGLKPELMHTVNDNNRE